ncbi:uncharacterized protein G2W53_001959 [Senna tora]|uniref:Uncharacterized protein n=1 Tax=Senna tora TaxID=362788 RepID=A0A835CJX1_9FABA|nr:uncharacterized protein G2W53_001959 [Senna tora]
MLCPDSEYVSYAISIFMNFEQITSRILLNLSVKPLAVKITVLYRVYWHMIALDSRLSSAFAFTSGLCSTLKITVKSTYWSWWAGFCQQEMELYRVLKENLFEAGFCIRLFDGAL